MTVLKAVLMCLVWPVLGAIDYDRVERGVEQQCIQHCPLQNHTDLGRIDYACDAACNIDQCSKGCSLWKEALSTSCQKACNRTSDRLSHRELHCVIGCNDGTGRYLSQIRALLGVLAAPALLDNSLGATSLRLEWRLSEASRTGLSCHVQWRYEESAAAWQYAGNVTWNPETNHFLVEGLQPYTKYRFRVALNLGHGHGEPIFSEQSLVIATLAEGVPASPPRHLQAAAVDAHSVSVTWEPGPFPHGPLLSYVLQIIESRSSTSGREARSEVKDVDSTHNFYLYSNLRPNVNYTVTAQMRNSVGVGPSASVEVLTPKEQPAAENEQLVLILGTQHGIFELKSLFADSVHLFHSDETAIEGIGIHIEKQLLFVSDVRGSVWRLPIEQETKNKTEILSPDQLDFFPLDISVDWINNQLYIVGQAKPRSTSRKFLIKRCNLDGSGQTVVFAGLQKRPVSLEVDPCNGYLFWSVQDTVLGGIYRLDIADISNGVKHEMKERRIFARPNLGAFVVNYLNFTLSVADQSLNTMLEVALDGKAVSNIRANVAQPMMSHVLSLGTAYRLFYWTDGTTVYNEEYHGVLKKFFQNKISHLGKTQYKKILVNMHIRQPLPLPLNPPIHVQAVFGRTGARVKWLPPHLFGIRGKAAWQNWSYKVFVQNMRSQAITNYTTEYRSCAVTNLTADTPYTIKVLAFSKSGAGPLSTEFQGRTLESFRDPQIIWAGSEGLFKSDMTLDNVETLVHKDRMRNIGFNAVTWYRDQIFLVTNGSNVYWFNLTSRQQGKLGDVGSVDSIAVDWIGRKLYWSNLKQQLIIRSNLQGAQQEPLPILTLAKEIRIDSVNGYLYWSREYDVECARLNGDDRAIYDHLEPFSGRQVMGLTLDFDGQQVYWIVRGSDGSHLFRAALMGEGGLDSVQKSRVALLQSAVMPGPLSYFSRRLMWLQDERNAIISDLEGKNMATVGGKLLSGLNLVSVVDASLQKWPDNVTEDEVNVVPGAVRPDLVHTVGGSEAFNITWAPVENVNYGTVFYEVQLDGLPANNYTIITIEPSFKYWLEIAPFTPLNVTIRAFTYWSTSPQVRAVIYSPPSTPSVPINLRGFVEYEHNRALEDIDWFSIVFRWDPPLFPNGILDGFNVRYWYKDNGSEVALDIRKSSNETEHILDRLTDKIIYYFQVQAYTSQGSGAISEPLAVNASVEAPLPVLLVTDQDSLFQADLDVNRTRMRVSGVSRPLAAAYSLRERTLYWLNEMRELLTLQWDTGNKSKLLELKEQPKGLSLDWLGRNLYLVEGTNDTMGSVVHRLSLEELKVDRIYVSAAHVCQLEVAPAIQKLFWLETELNGRQTVKSSGLSGGDVKELLTDLPELEPTLAIDHAATGEVLIVVAASTREALLFDSEGTPLGAVGLEYFDPLGKVAVDLAFLYWRDLKGQFYSMARDASSRPRRLGVTGSDLLVFGQQMQRYPLKACLSPGQVKSVQPAIETKSYDFVRLQMPQLQFGVGCPEISRPTAVYTVRYSKGWEGNEDVRFMSTFNSSLLVGPLRPFTQYAISIAVANHYTRREEMVFGEPVLVRTAPGAPSKPRNISASVLHPTLAEVSWSPPAELNGELIHYEIHWLTEGSVSGVRQKGEQPVNDLRTSANERATLTTLVQKLSPNETYTVWIRAYSETNETSSDSDRVQITTFPEPAVFDLVNQTAHALDLTWEITPHIQEYVVEYAPITSSNVWAQAASGHHLHDQVQIVVHNLKPKTQYKFRLRLLYDQYPEWYQWPGDSRFTFETLGDRPSAPGTPGLQFFGSGIYKVVWEAPQDNGAPIELYSLESLALHWYRNKRSMSTPRNRSAWFANAPSVEEEPDEEAQWEEVYNGTDNSWIIGGLDKQYKYAFRVSALNSYGWSDPSAESTEFDVGEAERMSQKNPMDLIFIATFLPISVCILIVICFGYVAYSRRRRKQKKIEHVIQIPRGPDVELATLRELPRRGVHNTNILYVSSTPDGDDLAKLPHIRRDRISLNKFLGSGAFGEVFEGTAKIGGDSALETKVAVKTLKKAASDQEKTDFLQEAQLMSHFKHDHILELLGVCLDNDPQFLIMELMEGGDLLTYLRNSRGHLNDTPSLSLIELLKMCLDVTKGCRYLEEMHFVHRDLACRNCLVSSMASENRIVKIGDFGLARDIYKNDYYRKEGEGLLPVRWMAPESLLDGVFTCQSDVWAYGVLLWEIMTLGQQPYQARSNLEVLHYIRGGGRLGKPKDCPEDLYWLMLQCWLWEVEQRPTFKRCLEVLDQVHRDHLRRHVTGAHSHYVSTVIDLLGGISNAAYFLDENKNSSGMSWTSGEENSSRERAPFLPPASEAPADIPKYLELVYEPEEDQALENDGYEIPNNFKSDLAAVSGSPISEEEQPESAAL
ncbi:hypothetical protein HUJ04_012034 [Dendroctonus ponderosae]|nr:hypothetical protein HUJ04_012034 [Dendroctonus ponderosae]